MTSNTTSPTFRGVECLHCKAPIPVPAIVSNVQTANDSMEASQGRAQVFNLRCPYCHKEKPYRTREIVDFEETFESKEAPGPRTPLNWYPRPGLARTAKA
jgi:hypothetical protein